MSPIPETAARTLLAVKLARLGAASVQTVAAETRLAEPRPASSPAARRIARRLAEVVAEGRT